MAELSADMVLTPADHILLARAVDLLLSRPSSANDRVRVTNAATRILAGIRRRQPPKAPAPPPSLQELMAGTR